MYQMAFLHFYFYFYATVNSKIGKRFNGKGRQKSYSVDTNHREVLVILLF